MSEPADLVTVFRSMDASAKEDAETLVDTLSGQGIAAVLVNDRAPGVPEGAYEVRVPADMAAQAEAVIAANPWADEVKEVDNSENLNLENIFRGEGHLAEFEALAIKNMLESNGIAAVLVGDSRLPNLPFEVRVAREQAARARELLAEASTVTPEAVEQAELESES